MYSGPGINVEFVTVTVIDEEVIVTVTLQAPTQPPLVDVLKYHLCPRANLASLTVTVPLGVEEFTSIRPSTVIILSLTSMMRSPELFQTRKPCGITKHLFGRA